MLAWMAALMTVATGLFAAESIGVVIALQGRATAAQPQAQARVLALKSDVSLNDRITTEAGAKLQILFNDDSVISQGENSTLVVDEYVYSPQKAADNNFAARMVKGAFRVITGEITKLNPDRFKVRGRLATIGIRGCDVGCRVGQTLEHVYVLELHRKENVVVGPLGFLDPQGAKPGVWQFDPVTVKRGGRAVSVEANKQVTERDFQPGELALFVNAVMPTPGAAPKPANPPKPAGGVQPGEGGEGGGEDQQTGLPRRRPLVRRRLAKSGPYVRNSTSGGGDDPIVDPPELDGPAGTGETPQASKPGPKFTVRDQGADWLWGVWTLDRRVVDVESRTDSPVDLATLDDYLYGSQAYHLQGDGTTGALITGDGARSYLEGTCRINVWTGYEGDPGWNGTFLLGANATENAVAGDSLRFQADGAILQNGKMIGNQSSYDLRFGGRQYGPNSIVSESIGGQLVGQQGNVRPNVTGTVGKYGFDHGNVKVKGVWGNDFPPPGTAHPGTTE